MLILKEKKLKKEEFNLEDFFLFSNYRLQILPSFQEGNFTTTGVVTTSLLVTDDTRNIIVHSVDLEINTTSISLKKKPSGEKISISSTKYDMETETLTITAGEDLVHDQNYELELRFSGVLNDKKEGFYRSGYFDHQSQRVKWVAASRLQPNGARRVFPCLDEPNFVSRFTVSIGRPNSMISLSNTILEESVPM